MAKPRIAVSKHKVDVLRILSLISPEACRVVGSIPSVATLLLPRQTGTVPTTLRYFSFLSTSAFGKLTPVALPSNRYSFLFYLLSAYLWIGRLFPTIMLFYPHTWTLSQQPLVIRRDDPTPEWSTDSEPSLVLSTKTLIATFPRASIESHLILRCSS